MNQDELIMTLNYHIRSLAAQLEEVQVERKNDSHVLQLELDKAKSEKTKLLEQIAELKNEVAYLQRQIETLMKTL